MQAPPTPQGNLYDGHDDDDGSGDYHHDDCDHDGGDDNYEENILQDWMILTVAIFCKVTVALLGFKHFLSFSNKNPDNLRCFKKHRFHSCDVLVTPSVEEIILMEFSDVVFHVGGNILWCVAFHCGGIL